MAAVRVANILSRSDRPMSELIAPLRRRFPPPGATSLQAIRIGVDAMPIVGLIAFLLGLIHDIGELALAVVRPDAYAEITTMPVLTRVSQATLALASWARIASSIASDIWSATLSGCPSETDSDVNS